MKNLYLFLIVFSYLAVGGAQAQNWRPFRPNGDVHAFRGASADTVLTLRLDSAGVYDTDSVYYFNRIVRRSGNSVAWQKARNNQFGQQMRYNVATRTYMLFWEGEPMPMLTNYFLVLKPFARVGSTWRSSFTDYGVTTTLVSRGTALLDGVQDSVITFRAGNNPGVSIVLSKNNGLVSGPADLRFGVPGAKLLTLARRPAPAGLSYYNPLTLLDLQPGDELGYDRISAVFTTSPCYIGYVLRRVLTRQVTTDSIAYTFQQQDRTMNFNMPNCAGGGLVTSPVTVVRMAASRRTGEWGGPAVLLPRGSQLLAYAYQVNARGGASITMAYPVVPVRPGTECSGPAAFKQEALYKQAGGTSYQPGLDALAWQQSLAAGVGVATQHEYRLVYTRRTINGTVRACGNASAFATLLPTKAARAVATFQLYPNPATSTATLTLAAPARATATIRIFDALGRVVQHQPMGAEASAALALRGLAAGVYMVEVQAVGEAPQYLRLQLER
jgi:Secretion system C-terminal sorting domain